MKKAILAICSLGLIIILVTACGSTITKPFESMNTDDVVSANVELLLPDKPIALQEALNPHKEMPVIEMTDNVAIIRAIDSRVFWIKEQLKYYDTDNYFDGNTMIFKSVFTDLDGDESSVSYDLYYDPDGKLVYAEIAHYRYAHYSIYFQNDSLFHVEVGPFTTGGVSVNGGLTDVKAVIEKDEQFSFVLEDIAACSESAYSDISRQQMECVIANDFPAFTFEVIKTDKQELLEFSLEYTYTVSISCQEQPEIISQTFEVTSLIDGISVDNITNELSFVDMDFDGYLDIGIIFSRGTANVVFQYYRWDSGAGKYEETPFFEMVFIDYQLFPDTKQIIATSHSSTMSYGRVMYQLIDGEYVLLRAENVEIIKTGDGDHDYTWVVHIIEGQNEIYSETLTVEEYYDISAERDNALLHGVK